MIKVMLYRNNPCVVFISHSKIIILEHQDNIFRGNGMATILRIAAVIIATSGLLGMCPMAINAEDPVYTIEGKLIFNDTQEGVPDVEIYFTYIPTSEMKSTITNEDGTFTFDVGQFTIGTETEGEISIITGQPPNGYFAKPMEILFPFPGVDYSTDVHLQYDAMASGYYVDLAGDTNVASRQNSVNNVLWAVANNEEIDLTNWNDIVMINLGWGYSENGITGLDAGITYDVYIEYKLEIIRVSTQQLITSCSYPSNPPQLMYSVNLNDQIPSVDPHIYCFLTNSYDSVLLKFAITIDIDVLDASDDSVIDQWTIYQTATGIHYEWPDP